MTPDPLISDLHAVIARIAERVLDRPNWLLHNVSATDRVLVERVLQLAVLIQGGRHDVVH